LSGLCVAGAAALLLGLAGPAAAAAGSCLIDQNAKQFLKGATVEDADPGKTAVARPCEGQVTSGSVEVLYSTGDGPLQAANVKAGESIERHIRGLIGPSKQLVDVLPKRSVLAVLMDVLNNRRSGVSGVSGFEGKDGGVGLKGDLLALPGTRLHLQPFGMDAAAPVKLEQGKWSATLTPSGGAVLLPVDKLGKGPLKVSQGAHSGVLNVIDKSDAAEVVERLDAVKRSAGDARAQAIQRAYLLQEEQLQVNAVSEYMNGR
jgi:hypothetical protein